MSAKVNGIEDFVTYPRTFEKYAWYKPLITIILSLGIYLLLVTIEMAIFGLTYGFDSLAGFSKGYEGMNTFNVTTMALFISLILYIPALYTANKIVRDRPFSSFASSRGGWNWKLYFKCASIPLIVYVCYYLIGFASTGFKQGPVTMTLITVLLAIIIIPLQGIAEEYIFRSMLLQAFGSWLKMPIVAIIIQAVIFGMVHSYNSIGNITILVNGILWGILAWKTNGIEASSAIHSVSNLLTMLAIGFGLISTISSTISMTAMIFDILISVICAALVLFIGEKYQWFDEVTE